MDASIDRQCASLAWLEAQHCVGLLHSSQVICAGCGRLAGVCLSFPWSWVLGLGASSSSCLLVSSSFTFYLCSPDPSLFCILVVPLSRQSFDLVGNQTVVDDSLSLTAQLCEPTHVPYYQPLPTDPSHSFIQCQNIQVEARDHRTQPLSRPPKTPFTNLCTA